MPIFCANPPVHNSQLHVSAANISQTHNHLHFLYCDVYNILLREKNEELILHFFRSLQLVFSFKPLLSGILSKP